jgi:hypothetical protein
VHGAAITSGHVVELSRAVTVKEKWRAGTAAAALVPLSAG